MRALTFQGLRALKLESLPDPRIEAPGDAIVAVRLAGICGSDLHPYHGREQGLDPGTVMGHEFVGEVVETGAEVRALRRGDRVLSPFTTSCGSCFFCRSGLTARCESGQLFGWRCRGRGLHGAQAEYVRVPLAESTLVPMPESLGEEVALLLGDVLATGYHGVRSAGFGPQRVCAVVGAGPVGLSALVAARELGAERVFAIDSVPERLALAGEFGASPVHRLATDPLAVLREATEGRGADAVLEAVGGAAPLRLALDLVRPGGTVAVVGVHNEDRFPLSPAEAYDKNLTFTIGRCPARALFTELIAVARRRNQDLTRIITHRLPLDEGPRGYEVFDRKLDGCIKAVLRP